MQRLAQAWLVLELTDSPFALGMVLAFQYVPILLLSLPAGLIADRVPKRALVTRLQAIGVVQAGALGILTVAGLVELWHIYALALVSGVLSALDSPARMTFIGELVPDALLHRAVGLNSTVFNLTRVIGPAIAGGILAAWGAGPVFLLNAVSYGAVVVALAAMDASTLRPHRRATGRGAAEVVEGIHYALARPEIAGVLLAMFFMGTFGYNFNVILPALARFEFGVGPSGLGAMNAVAGVGAVLGAFLVASRAAPRASWIVGAAAVYAALIAAIGAAPNYATLLALLALNGLAGYLFFAAANAGLQMASAPEFRGRILSFVLILSTGTAPLGNSWTGFATEHWGVRIALLANGVLGLAGAVMALAYLRARPVIASTSDVTAERSPPG